MTYLIFALIASSLIALLSGPLGSIIIWRRLSFLGDTLAHSTFLGIALSTLLHLEITWGIFILALILGIFFVFFSQTRFFTQDILLSIFSQSSLALGMVALSVLAPQGFSYQRFLFGDILTVTGQDLLLLGVFSLCFLAVIFRIWPKFMTITINEDLAFTEGISVLRLKIIFMLLLTTYITLAVKMMGILLITSMMVIPAAIARPFARTPIHMMTIGSLVALIISTCGMMLSWRVDLAPATAVVTFGFVGFLASQLYAQLRTKSG